MIIEDSFEQRSEQWYQAKAGVPGASSFDKIITPGGAPSKQAIDYAYQLAGEKMLGRIEETYTSFAMQQGIDREDDARRLYGLIKGEQIRQAALIYKNESKSVACSPDGLFVELKCPILKTHIKYTVNPDLLVKDYRVQLQGSMWVCGRDSWDIMSYYPGLDEVLRTVKRDDDFCNKLGVEMVKFLDQLKKVYEALKGE